jgi:uncharacterized protein YecT (DUF1311 family)
MALQPEVSKPEQRVQHMMIRYLIFAIFFLASEWAVLAQDFEPSDSERAKIADCLKRAASETELKHERLHPADRRTLCRCDGCQHGVDRRMSQTRTDDLGRLSQHLVWRCPGQLKGDTSTASALKQAQRAWIASRDAKCAYWEKRYEGGTIVSVLTGDCMRVETGIRALEMRTILDDLN